MESFVGLNRIKENTNKSEIIKVCQTLIKIFDDIIKSPDDSSKRCIKLESDDVSMHLMPFTGGMETLFEIGFEENNDSLCLPDSIKIDLVSKIRNELDKIKASQQLNDSNKKLQVPSTPHSNVTDKLLTPSQQNIECTPRNQICKSTLINPEKTPVVHRVRKSSYDQKRNHQKFSMKLQRTYDHVLLYEQVQLKQKAKSLTPIDRFNADASMKLKAYNESLGLDEQKPYDLRDFLLLELMAWFKNEFFKWVNQPECDHCGNKENMKFAHTSEATSSENIWMAGNVEVYKCPKEGCGKLTRFARYNHPEKLLETRRGRCGEWANCFCLFLRSLDFDTRYILDWTDHVWNEVFSESQQRWLHVDPCENIMDKPLIYEHGWNKQLSYIIAFSSYQCIDVSWRYTTKFSEVMARRNECCENWLVKYSNKLSSKRQLMFNKEKVKQIQLRSATEIVEFLSPKSVRDGEDVGRQSGSLQWRMNRGEIQLPDGCGYCFQPEETDLVNNSFQVQYNTVTNTYTTSSKKVTNGWKQCISKCVNIQYKSENDWRMVYLARTEGSQTAFIEWSFDLSKFRTIGKHVKKISLKLKSKCFENAKINWSIFCNENLKAESDCFILDTSNETSQFKITGTDGEWTLSDFSNEKNFAFKVKAELSGGVGHNAWQHTQLFRQSLDNNENLFEISFYF